MTSLAEIVTWLDDLLQPQLFRDASLNGIQVESSCGNVRTIAFAVDAGKSVIEKAVAAGANLLIVHHGLLWGQPAPISGALREKVELLLRSGCSLYCSHLPLDGNRTVGNAYELARYFELLNLRDFMMFNGNPAGAAGETCRESLEWFLQRGRALGAAGEPLVLPFGPNRISRVGVVPGSGADAVSEAKKHGLDLLITGEPKQRAYHEAKELGLNVIFFGHYATETLGVKALMRELAKDIDASMVFVDEPTGI